MSKLESHEVLEMLNAIDTLPAEDFAHIIARALREYEHLSGKVIIGNGGVQPVTWRLFIAAGNHVPTPAYAIRPSPESAEDFAAVDEIMKALKKRKLSPFTVEEIAALASSGILTAAVALYGTDANDKPVLALAHHPSMKFAQAAAVILGLLHMFSEEQKQGKS